MHDQEDEIKARLIAKIIQLRRAKGWSHEKMALACDLDKSQYIKLEKGVHLPGIPILCKIADGLGLTLSEVVEGVYPKPKK